MVIKKVGLSSPPWSHGCNLEQNKKVGVLKTQDR